MTEEWTLGIPVCETSHGMISKFETGLTKTRIYASEQVFEGRVYPYTHFSQIPNLETITAQWAPDCYGRGMRKIFCYLRLDHPWRVHPTDETKIMCPNCGKVKERYYAEDYEPSLL